jgi:hypothetical protein
MSLQSATEDLQTRTLRAISGLLGKLDYLAGLRQADGSYAHWGLSRIHGEAATQRALAEAHQGLVSVILRTPLRKLLQDVDDSSRPKNLEQADFLERLNEGPARVVPPAPGSAAAQHLSSVLRALASLVKTRP